MKFKVGQRVTVNVEGVKAGDHSNGVRFNSNMSKYHGENFEVHCLPYDDNQFRLFGNPYVWSPEWLILADGEQPGGQWGYEGKLYDVVDRHAYKGELMLVIDPEPEPGGKQYKKHDVLKCTRIMHGDRYHGSSDGDYLYDREYKTLLPVEEVEPCEESKPSIVTEEVATAPVSTPSQENAPDPSWKKPVTPYGVLEAARKHMLDRAATYDSPEGERSMKATVQAFNAIHGTELTEAQGWTFMTLLKLVRTAQREAYHADSYEDAAAYVGLAAEAKAKEAAI